MLSGGNPIVSPQSTGCIPVDTAQDAASLLTFSLRPTKTPRCFPAPQSACTAIRGCSFPVAGLHIYILKSILKSWTADVKATNIFRTLIWTPELLFLFSKICVASQQGWLEGCSSRERDAFHALVVASEEIRS